MEATITNPQDLDILSTPSSDASSALKSFLSDLEDYLGERVSLLERDLESLARDSLTTGGKRIRPALVFACGGDNPEIRPNLVKAAAIVEFVHVATLVHDDVLDDATIRRGRRSLYASHGATAAILLGDALFAHALEMASEFPDTEVCRLVAKATRRTCSGEIRQSFLRGDFTLNLAEYRSIVEAKTAELFQVSCVLGASLSGREQGLCRLLGEFGRGLGLSYQIYDDLADAFGNEENMGKTLGRDLSHGKVTLPLITLFSKLPESQSQQLLAEFLDYGSEPSSELISRTCSLLEEHAVYDHCRAYLENELRLLERILGELKDSSLVMRLDYMRLVILDKLKDLRC